MLILRHLLLVVVSIYVLIFLQYNNYNPDTFVAYEEAIRNGESFTCAPKIIFEVVSKSTASHDYITKLAVYQITNSVSLNWHK